MVITNNQIQKLDHFHLSYVNNVLLFQIKNKRKRTLPKQHLDIQCTRVYKKKCQMPVVVSTDENTQFP